jgi:hypothetical protein
MVVVITAVGSFTWEFVSGLEDLIFYYAVGFKRMHAVGLKHNICTIAINRPEYKYTGSSKYTDEHIKQAAEGQKTFLDLSQLRLAYFLQFVVTELQVPRYDKARNSGGISVMAWSIGVLLQLSLLGDPTVIPKNIYNVIEPEMRNMIMYGNHKQQVAQMFIDHPTSSNRSPMSIVWISSSRGS